MSKPPWDTGKPPWESPIKGPTFRDDEWSRKLIDREAPLDLQYDYNTIMKGGKFPYDGSKQELDFSAFPKAECGHPVRMEGGPHICCICAADIVAEADGWPCGHNAAPLRDPRTGYSRCCAKCGTGIVVRRRSEIMDFLYKQSVASATPHNALAFRDVVRREMLRWVQGWDTSSPTGNANRVIMDDIANLNEIVVWDSNLVAAALRNWELFKNEPFNRNIPLTLVVANGATYVARTGEAPDGRPYILCAEISGSTPRHPILIEAHAMVGGEVTDGHEDETRDLIAKLAAMFAFMDIEIIRRESVKLPRQTRRAMERKGEHVPNVIVVRLRRMTAADRQEHGESEVEWQHRWIVGGHWRQQWYPSLGQHKPKYIADYIKGPEGKPLLPKRPTVKVVDR